MKGQRLADVTAFPRPGAKRPNHAVSIPVEALFTREEWPRLAAQGSRLGLWFWNEVTNALFWDPTTRDIFGVNHSDEVTLKTFYHSVHRDDLARVKESWRHQLESGQLYKCQFRVQRLDGSIRWVDSRGSGFYDKGGRPLHMIGVVFDITERKEIEQERLELSSRLISAQEQERRYLAQELHDDFGQRLSLLHIELQALAGTVKATDVRKRVVELVGNLSAIVDDLQSLSHRLHPSKLDILGLASSLRSLCAKFAKQYGIQIDFGHTGLPESLPPDTKMGLFRIVQEGLHNVSKHSHASKVDLQLNADSRTISLSMFDNGTGFNVIQNYSAGIGIQSMKERARRLGGSFEIRSRPSVKGTQIAVTVPLKKAA